MMAAAEPVTLERFGGFHVGGRAGWTQIPEQTGGAALTSTVGKPRGRFRTGAGSFVRS